MSLRSIILPAILIIIPVFTGVSQDLEQLKDQKPVTFHGSITNTFLYNNSGQAGVSPELIWAVSGNATLSVYGIQLPISFSYSDKKANYSQPFNQFGLSPKYKWITLHLGYRNVTFSDYTLAGYTFLGVGLELTPGIFRFGFIWGRFVRSSTSNGEQSLFTIPSLSRKGYAMKLGVGSPNNYVDLIWFSAKDDSSTLKQTTNDSLATPSANICTGVKMHFTIIKPLTLDVEGAVSLFTSDTRLTSLADSSSDPWLKRLNRVIPVNLSSAYYTAVKASLLFKKPSYTLGLTYTRIDPGYQTMGIYYLNNDLENITFNPSFYLFKRKFRFSGSGGYQHDNLHGSKTATSMRLIGNLTVGYDPVSWFGFDATFSNFSTTQKAGNVPLVDSLKIYNVNRSLSINPRLLFVKTSLVHSVILSFNQNDYIDRNATTSDATTRATTILLNYSLTIIKSQLGLNMGLSYIDCRNSFTATKMSGGNAGISKTFFKNKLFCSLGESVQNSEIASQQGWVFNTNASLRYQPHPKHTLILQVYLVDNSIPDKVAANVYNQSRGDLSYVFTF